MSTITQTEAANMISDCIESLVRSGTIEAQKKVTAHTVILGRDSNLDSLGFITLVTELEDRLEKAVGREIYLVLDEIDEFNIDNPSLTVAVLSQYIETLSQNEV